MGAKPPLRILNKLEQWLVGFPCRVLIRRGNPSAARRADVGRGRDTVTFHLMEDDSCGDSRQR